MFFLLGMLFVFATIIPERQTNAAEEYTYYLTINQVYQYEITKEQFESIRGSWDSLTAEGVLEIARQIVPPEQIPSRVTNIGIRAVPKNSAEGTLPVYPFDSEEDSAADNDFVISQGILLRDPENGSYKIEKLRVGKVLEWYPQHVKLRVYNEQRGEKQDIILPKSTVALVENPFFAIMNEPNSTMQRLIRKLNILDAIDEQSGSGKLNLIIQLPYVIKTEARRQQAEKRRRDIEEQLSGSKYGVAYTDGTEHVVQLNRPIDNNLMSQIEYLTSMLYSQLGITQGILDGTADDRTKLNYDNRTIEPILSAIVDEMKRKFLTKTARSQKQSILFFRDPFRLVPINDIAEIADKMTRNEIMTSNEIRQKIGMKPSKDPKADELRNSNLSAPKGEGEQPPSESEGGNVQNGSEV